MASGPVDSYKDSTGRVTLDFTLNFHFSDFSCIVYRVSCTDDINLKV